MNRRRVSYGLGLLACLALSSQALAQDNYTYTLAGFFGTGGPYNLHPDPGLSNRSFQIEASMVTQERTLVGIRAARLSFDANPGIGPYRKADLDYLTIAGEYRTRQSYYDFGMYVGLGGYRLDGPLRAGGRQTDTNIGLSLGLTGDFDVSRHLSVVAELSGHYTWLTDVDIFAVAHAGIAFHF